MNALANYSVKPLLRYLPWIVVSILLLDLLCFNQTLSLRGEESRRALVSIEMLESGNFTALQLHGTTYYNKPPLYNWILAFVFKVFGSSSEWVLRFPGIISLMLTSLVFYLFLRARISSQVAMLISVAFLCTGDLLFYGSINSGEIDLFYSMLVVCQILSIFHFFEKEKWWQLFLISYFLVALGVLTKGVPSVAFQILTIVPFFLLNKKWKLLFSIQHIAGVVLLLLITGGYVLFYSINYNAVAYVVNIIHQASQRTVGESTLTQSITAILQFPSWLLGKLMPWPLFGIPLIFKKVREQLLLIEVNRFFVLLIATNIWIYWLSPKIGTRYLYMFFPFFAAIFIQTGLSEGVQSENIFKVLKRLISGSLFFASLLFVIAPSFEWGEVQFAQYQKITLLLVGIVLTFIAIALWKLENRLSVLWTILLAMTIGRLAFNLVALPLIASEQKHKSYTLNLIEKAGENQIYQYGSFPLNPRIVMFGETYFEQSAVVPIELPYSIPYYYFQYTGNIMLNMPNKESGKVYYSFRSLADKNDSLLDTNTSIYKPLNMALFIRN